MSRRRDPVDVLDVLWAAQGGACVSSRCKCDPRGARRGRRALCVVRRSVEADAVWVRPVRSRVGWVQLLMPWGERVVPPWWCARPAHVELVELVEHVEARDGRRLSILGACADAREVNAKRGTRGASGRRAPRSLDQHSPEALREARGSGGASLAPSHNPRKPKARSAAQGTPRGATPQRSEAKRGGDGSSLRGASTSAQSRATGRRRGGRS